MSRKDELLPEPQIILSAAEFRVIHYKMVAADGLARAVKNIGPLESHENSCAIDGMYEEYGPCNCRRAAELKEALEKYQKAPDGQVKS